jgi:hypothetical protein
MTIHDEPGQMVARYFRATFPAEYGEHGAGVWYAEFVDGVPRRQFEVYADRVLVAPYDLLFADQYDIVLQDEHYVGISLAEFEKAFDEFATKRFREIGE